MNTRTAANASTGKGAEPFVRLLIQNYPNQRVGIIYDDFDGYVAIEKLLIKEGNAVTAFPVGKKDITFPENVRYLAGVGSARVIPEIKKHSENRRTLFYCSEPDYAFFRGEGGYAEYVYYDECRWDFTSGERLLRGYVRLFSLYTEAVNAAAGGLAFPFKISIGAVEELKDFLLKGKEKESYIKEYLRVEKNGVAFVEKNGGFTLDYIYKDRTTGEEFLLNFLLFVLCEIFTKWNFTDILMQNKERNDCFYDRLDELNRLRLNKDGLALCSAYAKSLKAVFPKDARECLVSLLTVDRGFFGEINGRGIIEGLLNYGKEGI